MFSIVLQSGYTKHQVLAFVNRLELFKIGCSWGGVTSLAVAYGFSNYKGRPSYQHRIVRLNIGLGTLTTSDVASRRASFKVLRND